MVHVREVAQLRQGQLLFRRQAPHPAGLGAQPGEAIGQKPGVGGLDLPYEHH